MLEIGPSHTLFYPCGETRLHPLLLRAFGATLVAREHRPFLDRGTDRDSGEPYANERSCAVRRFQHALGTFEIIEGTNLEMPLPRDPALASLVDQIYACTSRKILQGRAQLDARVTVEALLETLTTSLADFAWRAEERSLLGERADLADLSVWLGDVVDGSRPLVYAATTPIAQIPCIVAEPGRAAYVLTQAEMLEVESYRRLVATLR